MILVSPLYMNGVINPPLSMFIGYGYSLHGGSECNQSSGLVYHVFFIPRDVKLKDAIMSAY